MRVNVHRASCSASPAPVAQFFVYFELHVAYLVEGRVDSSKRTDKPTERSLNENGSDYKHENYSHFHDE